MSRKLSTLLRALGACDEAVTWAKPYTELQAAWDACPRGEWMLWLCGELNVHEPECRRIAFRIADHAVRVDAVAALRSAAAAHPDATHKAALLAHADALAGLHAIDSRAAAGAAGDAAWEARDVAWEASAAAGAAGDAAWEAGDVAWEARAAAWEARAAAGSARAAAAAARAAAWSARAAAAAARAAAWAARAAAWAASAAAHADMVRAEIPSVAALLEAFAARKEARK